MLGHMAQRYLRRSLARAAGGAGYPLLVGAMSLGATLSMSIPFAPILVFAVLLQPRQAGRCAGMAALGSALGGVALYLLFHHWGWRHIAETYPELVHGRAWSEAARWLSRYGVTALGVIAATPLPTTPGLVYAALTRLPLTGIFLALLAGKGCKFALYAWAAVRFPEQFRAWFIEEGGILPPGAGSA